METRIKSLSNFSRRLTYGFLKLVAVFVLYALSSGPVLYHSPGHGNYLGRVTWKLYAPLRFFAVRTSTKGLLDGYIDWWFGRRKTVEGSVYYPAPAPQHAAPNPATAP